MPIVQSFGAVQAIGRPPTSAWVTPTGSVGLYGGLSSAYGELYRTQPNVRTVIDFLARNIAQVGLHVYQRLANDDRIRRRDLEQPIRRPSPLSTRYRLLQDSVADLGVYFAAFWLKVRLLDRLGLVRLPAAQMRIEGGLFPTLFVWTSADGTEREFPPSEMVYFSGYDPDDPLRATSPLETLRHILAEEAAAGDYWEHFWSNAARQESVIERPATAPPWEADQRDRFRREWQESTAGGEQSGLTAILEDGMTLKPIAFSMRQSEYLGARKLTREECAAAYHIPLPLVGILEHATFSNIKEQHKHLYQDSLGPWFGMIEEDYERQVLGDPFFGVEPDESIYAEFNIAEKLKGSFEEQAGALTTLIGAPVMTRNEGRARLNLPRDPNPAADELVRPLNVDTPSTTPASTAPSPPRALPPAAGWVDTVQAFWRRQAARLEKDPPAVRVAHFDRRRWNRELTSNLLPHFQAAADDTDDPADSRQAARALAAAINDETLARLEAGLEPFSRDRALPDPDLAAPDPTWRRNVATGRALRGMPPAPVVPTVTVNAAPITVTPAPITVDVHVVAAGPMRRTFTRDPATQLITEEIHTPIEGGAS